MNQPSENRTVRDYLRILRERRMLIIASVVVAGGAALVYSVVKEPQYAATAAIGFKDQSADLQAAGSPVSPSLQPDKQAGAGARIVTRSDVVNSVRASLGSNLAPSELTSRVSTQVEPDSNLVDITATDPSAAFSAKLANAFALQTQRVLTNKARAQFRAAAQHLKGQLAGLSSADAAGSTGQAYRDGISRLLTLSAFSQPVEIARPAEVPASPSSPKPIRDTILAGFLGLMIGLGAAFLRHALDRRVTEPHEVQHQLGIPIVGYVRDDALGQAGLGLNGDGGFSGDDLEAFRILRTNFDFLGKDREQLRSVVVTSSLPEEGKSTVATWFAYANAVAGRRTLLIECDFRRPVLAERLGLKPAPGLSDYLGGAAKPSEILHSVAVDGRGDVEVLPVIVAGENVFLPTEMLGSKRFSDFLVQVSRAYELVVIDAAPLLPVGDTLELLPQVDAALFCVRIGQTTRDQAQRAKAALEHLPGKPTGLVVTGVKRGGEDDYYGYYSYAAADSSKPAPQAAAPTS